MDEQNEPTDADFEAAVRAITDDQWQSLEDLLGYLPESIEGIRWHGGKQNAEGVMQFPYVFYGEDINRVIAKIYDIGLVVPFDWMKWDRAHELHSPEALEEASMADALRYLVAALRADRFVEGTLQELLVEGRFDACIQNIATWRRFDTALSRVCPNCGGSVVPLYRGLPGPEVFDMAERGEVALGGCVIEEGDQPTVRCTQCGTDS